MLNLGTTGVRWGRCLKQMLLLCFVANQQQCLTAFDSRGPYETLGQCNDRLAEMTIDILTDPRTAGEVVVSNAIC